MRRLIERTTDQTDYKIEGEVVSQWIEESQKVEARGAKPLMMTKGDIIEETDG